MRLIFSYLPRLAWRLSDDRPAKTLTLLVVMWYFVLSRSLLGERRLKLRLNYGGSQFDFFIWSLPDLVALLEVYLWNEYEWDLPIKPRVIIDLGAHQGDSSVYYALKYPEASVYAVEPAPDSFDRLDENVSQFANIKTVNLGIGKKDGEASLHITQSSLGNSLIKREHANTSTQIKLSTLESLVAQIGEVDLIKFDIEGSEQFLFIDYLPRHYANYYIGEVHPDLIDISKEEFLEKFSEFNVKTKPARNKKRFIMRANLNT